MSSHSLPHPPPFLAFARSRRCEVARPAFRDIHELVDTLRWLQQRNEARRG